MKNNEHSKRLKYNMMIIFFYLIVCRADQLEKVKSMSSIFVEFLILLVKCIYYIMESVYYKVVPLPEKSIADDIVLVGVL